MSSSGAEGIDPYSRRKLGRIAVACALRAIGSAIGSSTTAMWNALACMNVVSSRTIAT